MSCHANPSHMPIPMAVDTSFLQANNEVYERVVERLQTIDYRTHPKTVLERAALAARVAAVYYPGRFADGAVENPTLEVGVDLCNGVTENIGFLPASHSKEGHRRRLLHVATHVAPIGGHTRMLDHWVRSDQSSRHSLVLVNQRDGAVPPWLSASVRDSGGQIVIFPSAARLLAKAQALRQLARRDADLVVLHHGPWDVVPTTAFALCEGPPVALVNIADHQFWVGGSVSDIVISLRSAGAEHAAERRFAPVNTVLPVPLACPSCQISRVDARQVLGIPVEQIMLLSIGRAEKYRPCGSFDFVQTAGKILDRQPRGHLYVVGESASGITPYLRVPLHERLHLIGSIEDPFLYRSAADLYLESFPFGSQTALLEAALSKLALVPAYAPLFPLLVANDDALNDLIPRAQDEQGYIEQVDLLIRQPTRRAELGEALQKRLLIDHVGDGWLNRLAGIYRQTAELKHSPRQLPVSRCSVSAADASLSLWRAVPEAGSSTGSSSRDAVAKLLRHSACVAKFADEYSMARSSAIAVLRRQPLLPASWRLLASTVLGKPMRLIRHMLLRGCASTVGQVTAGAVMAAIPAVTLGGMAQ
jgi:hypothetical protein